MSNEVESLGEGLGNVYDAMVDYEPEVVKDSFDVIKGKFVCTANTARVGMYDGPTPELEGHKQLKLDLIIDADQKYEGRHLFKTFDISRPAKEYVDKKTGAKKLGKTGVQLTMDALWTCGIKWIIVKGDKAKTEENLVDCARKLTEMKILVRGVELYQDAAGNFVSKKKAGEGAEPRQGVKLLGEAKVGDKTESAGSAVTPF